MNIFVKNDHRVEILLTGDELKALDITYDELDYGNVETRRVLWTLLAEIRRMSGTEIDLSGRLLIEANREKGDRYRISFSSFPSGTNGVPSVKQLIKCSDKPIVLECDGLDNAVGAAVMSGFDGKSELFFFDGFYRIVMDVSESNRKTVAARVAEFGELLEKNEDIALAECEESWKCIEKEKAVEKLKMLA